MAMTIQELMDEPLSAKNRRAVQSKCKHEPDAIFESTFCGEISFTDRVCVDCGTHWRIEH